MKKYTCLRYVLNEVFIVYYYINTTVIKKIKFLNFNIPFPLKVF